MHRDPLDKDPAVPFPLAPISNGEWMPRPATEKQRLAAKLIAEEIEAGARRHGMTRKQFLRTAAATATAFMVLNKIHGLDAWGDNAVFPMRREHCEDLDGGRELLDDSMFIMDVQAHHIDVRSPVATTNCFLRFNGAIRAFAAQGYPVSMSDLGCPEVLGQMNFIKEMFIDSQTTVAVLSGLPYSGLVIGPRQMAVTRDFVNELAGSQRAISQAMIEPHNAPGNPTSIASFARQVEEFGARTLKCYTYSGPGWRLDDDLGTQMLEEAQRLGIRLVNVHKGLPATFAPGSEESVRTTDLRQAVQNFPDIRFCAYHSGLFQGDHPEGKDGISEFIEVVESIPKKLRRNVYAEIGSSFAIKLLEGPEEAARFLGELLKTFGADNILWGTDSIWWGSPQFLIDAFKALQIPASMREQFGYPQLTKRAKKKILGKNAARLYGVKPRERRCAISADRLSGAQVANGGFRTDRSLQVYGARTRREFLSIFGPELKARG
jgi:predicted TIM-barrel fold metal-dependent hydrolase